MATQTHTQVTIDNQNKEQFMNYPTTSFLMTSPIKSTSDDIIVRSDDGVN